MSEVNLWNLFRRNIKEPAIQAWRVENTIGRGMPDVLCIMDGLVFWVELKSVMRIPKRPSTKLEFTTRKGFIHQVIFHSIWNENGGCSFLLLRYEHARRYFLFGGDDLGKLSKCMFSDLPGVSIMDETGKFPVRKFVGAVRKYASGK